jgi:uncharacterized protein YgbK (DUF1537 family)
MTAANCQTLNVPADARSAPARLVPRLLADDLTGALDSAARFVPMAESITTRWAIDQKPVEAGAIAIDSATRERSATEAARIVAHLAPLLAGGAPAFKKLDSLLRGHAAVELAATLAHGHFAHCILAPAFPFQGRVTRGGRQLTADSATGGWRDCGRDLAVELTTLGIPVRPVRAGEAAPAGVSLWDAETDADLRAIVAAGRALPGAVLWGGSGGLAGALAQASNPPALSAPALPRPLLLLVGSRHPVTLAQLAAIQDVVVAVGTPATDVAAVTRRLTEDGVVAVRPALPEGLEAGEATGRISHAFGELTEALDRPGTLFVTGGETLRGVCQHLRADALIVDGEIEPGVPKSVIAGGLWDGVRVVSKSGAFGAPDLFARVLRSALWPPGIDPR